MVITKKIPFQFLYQGAFGCIIRIEIKNGLSTSNDEDFHRYGASDYTHFFGFLCMGNQGWHQRQAEVDSSDVSEAYKTLQTELRAALRARMETCNKYIDRGPKAPEKDPMEWLPFKNFSIQPNNNSC